MMWDSPRGRGVLVVSLRDIYLTNFRLAKCSGRSVTFCGNFYGNCAHIFTMSMSEQRNEFVIYTMRQRERADNLTNLLSKKNWRQIFSYFDNVTKKFIINNRTDAWKTDVNVSNWWGIFYVALGRNWKTLSCQYTPRLVSFRYLIQINSNE